MDIGTAILLIGIMAIALGISISAFAFKHLALSMSAGVLWLIVGTWVLLDFTIIGNIPLGIFCLILAIVMFISPAFIQDKPLVPISRSYQEDMAEKIERMRGHGASFKPKGKDMML
jgi:hypothetical protein